MTHFLVPLRLMDFAAFDSADFDSDAEGILRVPASGRMFRHWVEWMFKRRGRRYVGLHESRD